MKNNRQSTGNRIIVPSVVFAIIVFVALGCNLSKFMKSANSTNSDSSDNRPTSTSGSVGAQCNNPYYPVSPSLSRKYHVSYPKGMLSDRDYTESFSDFSGDTFTVNTDFNTVAAHIKWRCTPDGLLATQYNNSIDMKNSGGSVSVETLDSKGVTFPSADKWQTGEKWQAEYHISENVTTSGGKSIAGSKGAVTQDGEVLGTEEVKVPAGTFQAVKIKITSHVNLTMNIPGSSGVPMNITLETTAWMAKDTGMVRSVTKMGDSGETTSELTSINK